jgi:hypothetical protein
VTSDVLALSITLIHCVNHAVFTFDLTTRLRCEFCCRAGPSIGDWPPALDTGRCDLRPSKPKLGEVFAEPQRVLIGGRRGGVSMRRRSGE